MSEKEDWIKLPVKYRGKCCKCGKEISTGDYALWSRSSKAIMHLKCEVSETLEDKKQKLIELDCFICTQPAGCSECGFEADCNREVVSHACICDRCMQEKNSYLKYQQAFLEKMRKVTRVKF